MIFEIGSREAHARDRVFAVYPLLLQSPHPLLGPRLRTLGAALAVVLGRGAIEASARGALSLSSTRRETRRAESGKRKPLYESKARQVAESAQLLPLSHICATVPRVWLSLASQALRLSHELATAGGGGVRRATSFLR